MVPARRLQRPLVNTILTNISTAKRQPPQLQCLQRQNYSPTSTSAPQPHTRSRLDSTPTTSHPTSHQRRALHTSPTSSAVSRPRRTRDLKSTDRGPTSKEDTQTDFSTMNVLGNTVNPSTSIDICTFDGFMLDSGLRISEGDGVLLTGSEALVWRPWMGKKGMGSQQSTMGEQLGEGDGVGAVGQGGDSVVSLGGGKVMHGNDVKKVAGPDAGLVNAVGQFEVPEAAWGVFSVLWPRPDMLIIGTGASIRPLAPATRKYLQGLGMRLEVLDTRNAASQFNLLATERGVQEIAAALVPVGFGKAG